MLHFTVLSHFFFVYFLKKIYVHDNCKENVKTTKITSYIIMYQNARP